MSDDFKQKQIKNVILSIETAVEGGSLAILKDGIEVDSWIGSKNISNAESALDQMSKLFERNSLKKNEINLIVVSKGAGSLTGEKIGLAIAKGLKTSLGCQLFENSVFEALLFEVEDISSGNFLTAIPFGKDQIQWMEFRKSENGSVSPLSGAQVSSREEFSKKISTENIYKAVILSSEAVNTNFWEKFPVIYSSKSLAHLIGLKYIFISN